MCEHEQNFHALDVVFSFFRNAMEDLIARSLYVFLIIRCSCLKCFLDKKHKHFDSNRCGVRGKTLGVKLIGFHVPFYFVFFISFHSQPLITPPSQKNY